MIRVNCVFRVYLVEADGPLLPAETAVPEFEVSGRMGGSPSVPKVCRAARAAAIYSLEGRGTVQKEGGTNGMHRACAARRLGWLGLMW